MRTEHNLNLLNIFGSASRRHKTRHPKGSYCYLGRPYAGGPRLFVRIVGFVRIFHRKSRIGRNRQMRNWQRIWWLLLLGLPFCSGCYDGEKLVKMARAAAVRSSLEDIDLGLYFTTMPRNVATTADTEMEFRVFGTARRHRVSAITKQLEQDQYRVRYAILTALRQSTPRELAQPDFAELRRRIKKSVNSILQDAPIQDIGISEVRIVYR